MKLLWPTRMVKSFTWMGVFCLILSQLSSCFEETIIPEIDITKPRLTVTFFVNDETVSYSSDPNEWDFYEVPIENLDEVTFLAVAKDEGGIKRMTVSNSGDWVTYSETALLDAEENELTITNDPDVLDGIALTGTVRIIEDKPAILTFSVEDFGGIEGRRNQDFIVFAITQD